MAISFVRRRLRPLVLPLALAAVLAACGGDSSDPADPATTTTATGTSTAADATATAGTAGTGTADAAAFPVTVDAANGAVTVTEPPERIVSLSPTATEVLFAVGAGEQVVAADEFSDYPEEAPTTSLSGFEPNVEAIAEYDPDLVVASSDPGDMVAGLDAAGIQTIIHPAATTLDETYRQINQLGAATGHPEEASDVVAQMQADIDDIAASMPAAAGELTYYHELDPSYFSVASGTFIGAVYERLGLTSIADAAAADAGAYPQLSAEFILEADPDLIFLADTVCCDVTAESVGERPGWEQLTAVQHGAIVELNDDIASRWGPRITDLMRQVADVAAEVVEPTGTTGTAAAFAQSGA